MPLDDDNAPPAPTNGPLPDVDPAALSSYARRDELTELRRAFDLLAAPAGSPAPPRAGGGRGATLAAPAITPASLAAFAAAAGWATPPPTWADDAVWEADDDADGAVGWGELRTAVGRARGPAAAAEPRALADVATFAAAADPVTWRLTGDAAAAGAYLRVGRGAELAIALADFVPGAPPGVGDVDDASTALAAALPVSLSLESYMADAARAQARAIKALPGGDGVGGRGAAAPPAGRARGRWRAGGKAVAA